MEKNTIKQEICDMLIKMDIFLFQEDLKDLLKLPEK
jgi:hypothetical protein